ncbi:MAG TPA: hypothetical protein VFP86_17660 [bacterium]|nr:hypothetical protein [bacterium]
MRRRGKHLGRPSQTQSQNFNERWQALEAKVRSGEVTRSEAARTLGVGRATIGRLLAQRVLDSGTLEPAILRAL